MARYTGPKTKIARKFGEPIFASKREIILLECMAPTAEERKSRNTAPS